MKKTTGQDVLQMVEDNHIWLNAMSCINPTDEFLKDIGRMVLQKLNHPECLLPQYLDDDPEYSSEAMQGIIELTKVLYLSINKS